MVEVGAFARQIHLQTNKLHLKQQLYSHHLAEDTSVEDHLIVFEEVIHDWETWKLNRMKEILG